METDFSIIWVDLQVGGLACNRAVSFAVKAGTGCPWGLWVWWARVLATDQVSG